MPSLVNIVRGQGGNMPVISRLFKSNLDKPSRAGEPKRQKAKAKWVERLHLKNSTKKNPSDTPQSASNAHSPSDEDSYLSSDPSSQETLKLQMTPEFTSSINETLRELGVFDSLNTRATSNASDTPVSVVFEPQRSIGTQALASDQPHATNALYAFDTEVVDVIPRVQSSVKCEIPELPLVSHRTSSRFHRNNPSVVGSTISSPETFAHHDDSTSTTSTEATSNKTSTPSGHGKADIVAPWDDEDKELPKDSSNGITKGTIDSGESSVLAQRDESKEQAKDDANASRPNEDGLTVQIKNSTERKEEEAGPSELIERPLDTLLENHNGSKGGPIEGIETERTEAPENELPEVDQQNALTATTGANENDTSKNFLRVPRVLLQTMSEFHIAKGRMQRSDKRCVYLEELYRQFEGALDACNQQLEKNGDNDAVRRLLIGRIEDLQHNMEGIKKEYSSADDARRKFTKNSGERARLTLDIFEDLLVAQGSIDRSASLDDPLVRVDIKNPPPGVDVTLLDPNYHLISTPTEAMQGPRPYQRPTRAAHVSNGSNDPTAHLQADWQHGIVQLNAKMKLDQARSQRRIAREIHDAFQTNYIQMLYQYENGIAPVRFQGLSKLDFDGTMIDEQRKEIRDLNTAEEAFDVAVAEARNVGVHCWSWDGSTCSSHGQQSTNGYLKAEEDTQRKISDSFQLDLILKWREQVEPVAPEEAAANVEDIEPIRVDIKNVIFPTIKSITPRRDTDADEEWTVRTFSTWESVHNKAHGYSKVLLEKWQQAQRTAQPFYDSCTADIAKKLAYAGRYEALARGFLKNDPVLNFCAISRKVPSQWGLNKTLET